MLEILGLSSLKNTDPHPYKIGMGVCIYSLYVV